jgi:hypothetical protein
MTVLVLMCMSVGVALLVGPMFLSDKIRCVHCGRMIRDDEQSNLCDRCIKSVVEEM